LESKIIVIEPGDYGAEGKYLLFFSYLVNDFAVASIVYVTVKGCPSVLWKSNTLPVNTNDPVLIGELVILIGVMIKSFIVGKRV
jgi:hypothetical protein